jgi:rhodanese-related sulfurtransferase
MVTEAKNIAGSITCDLLDEVLQSGAEVILLDVRTESEYKAGHIARAKWVPRGMLEFMAAKEKLGGTDEQYFIYCKVDSRAALAARTIMDLGFSNVSYLEGGFEAWVQSGRSIFNMHGELTVVELGKTEDEK